MSKFYEHRHPDRGTSTIWCASYEKCHHIAGQPLLSALVTGSGVILGLLCLCAMAWLLFASPVVFLIVAGTPIATLVLGVWALNLRSTFEIRRKDDDTR